MDSSPSRKARLESVDKRWGSLAAILILAAALTFDIVVIYATKGRHRASHDPRIVLMIATVFFGGPLMIALHELGHYFGGRWVGFQLELFAVGPLKVERGPDDRIRFKLNTAPYLMGGICAMAPYDDFDLLRRFRTVLLCGPLASALVGLLLGGLALLLKSAWPGAVMPVTLLALLSLGLAVMTLAPIHAGPFLSDGKRWQQLRAGGQEARRDECILRLMALLRSGVPARNWPDALFEELNSLEDGTIFEGSLHYFAYLRAVDQGALAQAAQHLDRVVTVYSRYGSSFGQTVGAEAAWFQAMYLSESEGMFEKASADWHAPSVPESTRTMAEAAQAIRDGDASLAREKLDKTWSKLPDLPRNQWVRARLHEMEAALAVGRVAS